MLAAMFEDLANRLRKRMRPLRKWARKNGVTCFRIYDRDLPDHPAVIDWYDGDVVLWTRARTRDEDEAADAAWRAELRASIQQALEPARLFEKRRQRQRGSTQYERYDAAGVVRLVREGDLVFEVNLSDYLDTGLFLDHRPLRARVGSEAAGKRLLNLFCYTGAFTVHAAAGDAAASTSVDLNRQYLEWAQRNLSHNHLADDKHVFTRGDCLHWCQEACDRGERFDLIVCDPPTFSNSKATEQDWSVGEHAEHLLQCCYDLLTAGGRCYFSTNFRRFRFPEGLPFSVQQEISDCTVPEDFRDRAIHRSWPLERT